MFLSEELIQYVEKIGLSVIMGYDKKQLGEFAKGAILICLDRLPKQESELMGNVEERIITETRRCHNAWNSAAATLRNKGLDVLAPDGFKNHFKDHFREINDKVGIFE